MSAPALRAAKNWLIFHGVAALVWLLRRLPHRFASGLGAGLGRLAARLPTRERRRALDNLARAFPAACAARRRAVVRGMFEQLGRSAMECVVMERIRPRIARVVGFDGDSLEVLAAALAPGRGAVFATAHFGNWELMAAAVARHAPVSVLYKPSYDPRFTAMIVDFRQRSGIEGIDVGRAGHLRRAVSAVRAGRVLGILVDQPPPVGAEGGVEHPFFDRPVLSPATAATLAVRLRCPLLLGLVHRVGPCQHAISMRQIAAGDRCTDAVELTIRLSERLESAIRAAPEHWVWSLDRWRSAGTGRLSSPSANCIPVGNG